ncbi:hypothetical protein OC835_002946 [Tilletia horrida]|nr:hypothetical protein OC835_002946 [Tilletia horrida]
MLNLIKHIHSTSTSSGGNAPRKVRILCLHGKGTNAAIMKSQTKAVCSKLEDICEFVFVDGLFECLPYPGADQFYAGPFYSWYEGNSRDSILRAEQHVLRLATKSHLGPFDGIAGFSQGGALAASIAARYCSSTTDKQSPFRFAIFLCTGLPLGWEKLGLDVKAATAGSMTLTNDASYADGGWSTVITPVRTPPADGASSNGSEYDDGDDEVLLGIAATAPSTPTSSPKLKTHAMDTYFQAELVPSPPTKITIPTAHIIGKRDSVNARGAQLYERSTEGTRFLHEHAAGHSIPRTAATTKGIEQVIRAVVGCVVAR